MSLSTSIRIGYVPEHFSTPLHFASEYFSLNATLTPFPSGTGHMVSMLQSNEIDVAIGLTEGFVAALANQAEAAGFKLVGTYVETPLCWAINTGTERDISSVEELEGKRAGCSRIGSGSHIMAHVLAEVQGWDRKSFPSPIPCQTFAALRDGVKSNQIDYFLWEYFTCKRYYESSQTSPIKKIGQIYSPWSSWKIAARDPCDERLDDMFEKLNQGIKYFLEHKDESIRYISTKLDYEEGDAREWLQGVKFAVDVRGVSQGVVQKTVEALQKADVVAEGSKDIRGMIGSIEGKG